MSHTGQAACSIQGANQDTLDEALRLLCEMFGGEIRPKGQPVHQWGGRKLPARGTVVAKLPCAYTNTDVDVFLERGEIRIVGDANSNDRVRAEIEKAYKTAAFRRTLHAKGVRTRLEMDRAKRSYDILASLA